MCLWSHPALISRKEFCVFDLSPDCCCSPVYVWNMPLQRQPCFLPCNVAHWTVKWNEEGAWKCSLARWKYCSLACLQCSTLDSEVQYSNIEEGAWKCSLTIVRLHRNEARHSMKYNCLQLCSVITVHFSCIEKRVHENIVFWSVQPYSVDDKVQNWALCIYIEMWNVKFCQKILIWTTFMI